MTEHSQAMREKARKVASEMIGGEKPDSNYGARQWVYDAVEGAYLRAIDDALAVIEAEMVRRERENRPMMVIGLQAVSSKIRNPEPSAQEEANPHGVWRCECCGEIADSVSSAFRWNGECWQHSHPEGQMHYNCRFFGPATEPAPVDPQVYVPVMRCIKCGVVLEAGETHRIFSCVHREPAPPVAVDEMPEAVRNACQKLRHEAAVTRNVRGNTPGGLAYSMEWTADRLESWYREHSAQRVGITPRVSLPKARGLIAHAKDACCLLPEPEGMYLHQRASEALAELDAAEGVGK